MIVTFPLELLKEFKLVMEAPLNVVKPPNVPLDVCTLIALLIINEPPPPPGACLPLEPPPEYPPPPAPP